MAKNKGTQYCQPVILGAEHGFNLGYLFTLEDWLKHYDVQGICYLDRETYPLAKKAWQIRSTKLRKVLK